MNQRDQGSQGPTLAARLAVRARRAQVVLTLGALGIYGLIFFPTYRLMGPSAVTLAVLPVAIAGWSLGLWAGMLTGLACFPLNIVLLNLVGQPGLTVLTGTGGGVLGTLLLVLVGGVVGRMSDLGRQAAQELATRVQAEKQLQRRVNDLAALYETSRDLAVQYDLPALLQTVLERASRLLAAAGAAIYLYDALRGELELALTQGVDFPLGTRLKLGEGMAGCVAETRQPLMVDHYATWAHRSPRYAGIPLAAAVQVPMLYGGELIGVLAVHEIGATTRRFTEAEAQLLSLFAGQVASAVRNARLFESLQQELAERKQAEAALRQAEAKYRSIFENAVVGIFQTTLDGRYLTANPTLARLYGCESPEELVAAVADLDRQFYVDPGRRAEFIRLMETQNSVARFESQVYCKDGRVIWVSEDARAIRDTGGRLIGFEGTTIDITERKRAEDALRSAEAMFRNLVEQSLVGVYIIQDGRFPYVNAKLAEIFGYTQDEIITSKSVSDLVREEDRVPVADNLRKRLQGEVQSLHYTFRGGRKDGSTIDIEVYGTRTQYNGRPAVIGTLLDITERKRAEAEIQRQLQRITALRAVDTAITASLDLRLTLSILLEQVMTQLHADAANILLLNAQSQRFEYAASRGFRTTALQYTRLGLGEGYAGRAALQREVVSVPDLPRRKTDFLRSPHFAQEGFAAYHAVPLIAKGKVTGVLEIFHRTPVSPDRDWLDFLETLAVPAAIAVDNASLFEDLQRASVELTLAYDATIEGWSRALDLRDKETEGHTLRVTEMTLGLARAMHFSETDLVHLRRGALLHDMGKMGIPDSILLNPGPLTEAEWVIMRKHPQFAYEMLKPIDYLRPALDIPYCHHEKWDGTGYPRGLKGDQIPLAARIFAVADVWDALTSDRPYRAAWPKEEVLEYIRQQAGRHFDPQVAQVFFEMQVRKATSAA